MQLLTAAAILTGPAGERITDGAVLLDGTQIRAVGTRGELALLAREAEHVDFPEHTVLPGLINAHAHLTFDASSDPVSTARELSDDVLLTDMAARAEQTLRSGITTVRDLGDRNGLALRLRDEINRSERTGPRILAAGVPLTPRGGHCWFLGGVVSSQQEIRERIAAHAAAGGDWIKVMGNGGQMTPDGPSGTDDQFTREDLQLIITTAHAHDLPVAIHAYSASTIAAAVDAGVDTVEHCTFTSPAGPDLRDDVAKQMAHDGVCASPALPVHWRWMWDQIGPSRAQNIADRLRWLDTHGVTMLTGTDAGVPVSPHGDLISTLQCYTHVGFAPDSVLERATTGTATALGLGARTGQIAPGLDADLIVVNGDPLDDNLEALRSPVAVVRAGHQITLSG